MEGILHKWTNYWNGWQPRWFILEEGVLSYYQSEQEVSKGCKGSLKVSACDISVHSTDLTRLDLVIPSEQHYCLRAGSTKERQQWLLALGAAKQTNGGNPRSCRHLSGGGSTDSLRSKRSELRLYCDLLMQQAHQLKAVASSRDPGPCIAELDEVGSNLSVTCDTFIRALDDCMSLVNESLVTGQLSPSHQPVTDLHHQRHREKRASVTNSNTHR